MKLRRRQFLQLAGAATVLTAVSSLACSATCCIDSNFGRNRATSRWRQGDAFDLGIDYHALRKPKVVP